MKDQKEILSQNNFENEKVIKLRQVENNPEVQINPQENTKENSKKEKLNEIFLAFSTIILGICYIIAEKTDWLNIYLLDYGIIDLEMIGWGVFNLTLTLSQVILIGGMFILGFIYILTLPTKKKEKESLQIYIENPDK
jgi:hypothetical protein